MLNNKSRKKLEKNMVLTAWSNGKNSFGFKISKYARDKFFDRNLKTAILELPAKDGFITAEANINKASFWNNTCRELISQQIKNWLVQNKLFPWKKHHPPKFKADKIDSNRFRVTMEQNK